MNHTSLIVDARTGRASWIAAMLAVAATYVYFLIFAEFALLELVHALSPGRERIAMGVLGAAGVAGAVLAARLAVRMPRPRALRWSFRGCAASATLAWAASSLPTMLVAAALVGLSLGSLTVILSSVLRGAAGDRRLGLCIGAGTGLAYAVCNLPNLFQATAGTQALVAAAVALLGSFTARRLAAPEVKPPTESDFSRRGLASWTLVLLALVWMDSAAFYIVQHTEALRAITWSAPSRLLANAAAHLLAALAGGLWIDRGGRVAVTALGAAALALACLMLAGTLPAIAPAAWCYTAGVSFYSVVLVEYPARSSRPGVAALVFGLAGWLGSALGIGMAQDLQRIPPSFAIVATAAIGGALLWRRRAPRLVLAALIVALAALPVRAGDEDAVVARGREVYIAEGCIHCHSQFIRPKAPLDVARWGPAEPLATALAGAPPLVGTRRQGPDLSHVGNRRSAEWQRLHLISPREVSPGSRMPAYAHLFTGGDSRGAALVAYLVSLGAESGAERQRQIAAWQPAAGRAIAPAVAQRRFEQLCAQCHGRTGAGDGALALRLSYRPPDWTREPWRHVPPGGDREIAVSRIIKFGLPGLPMAGHEYLPDADVVGLARYVQTLHKEPRPAMTATLPP